MARNTEISDARIELTAGLYDTDDGFRARVSGDAFSRIHVTPQGAILLGDGSAAPQPISSGGSSDLIPADAAATGEGFDDGDFENLTIIMSNGTTQTFPKAGAPLGTILLVPAGSNAGLWLTTESGPYTRSSIQPTGGQVVAAVLTTSLYIGNNTVGANAPDFVLLNSSNSADIQYDNTESGLSATTVQGAIDELAALIAAL